MTPPPRGSGVVAAHLPAARTDQDDFGGDRFDGDCRDANCRDGDCFDDSKGGR